MSISRGRSNRTHHWIRLIAGLLLLGMAAYAVMQQRQAVEAPEPPGSAERPPQPDGAERTAPSPLDPDAPQAGGDRAEQPDRDRAAAIIPGQTIRDLDGEVAYRGEVDVTATLARITAGRLLRFNNDGSTFQNRERRLPKQPAGYYKEYVHPTPGLSGPGPQRIVVGQQGETYYTPDHYQTFRRLDE